MKRIGVLLALTVGVALVAWLAHERGWGRFKVTAFIENVASESVQSATLHIETCGEMRSIPIGSLNSGERRRIQYQVCGEGRYTVLAQFNDGRRMEGGGGYIESGYVATDRISADRVTSSQALY